MALLLYSVTEDVPSLKTSAGVAGSAVAALSHCGLLVFYSQEQDAQQWLKVAIHSAAQEFHRVQRELFHSSAIVPFRFPTIMEDIPRLREHIAEHANEYKSTLRRFSGLVQMDVVITITDVPQRSSSGKDYLLERQARMRSLVDVAETLQTAAGPLAQDWRKRSTSNGLRCFALVARERIADFNEKMKTARVPPDFKARLSGPWPVAEFIDLHF